MLNITQRIEITATAYLPQFRSQTIEYYNTEFYVTTASLEDMFKNKYAKKDYQSAMRPFKVVIL